MKKIVLLLAVCAALSACAEGPFAKMGRPLSGTVGNSDRIAGAMVAAAREAENGGMTQESLMFYKKLYNKDPRDPNYILNYAGALRRMGKIADARLVVQSPASDPRADEPLKTEYAKVLIAAGNYDDALTAAQSAVSKNPNSPYAHHALALAMSGMNQFSDAELQFREALRLWPQDRDKTAIVNNLAMCLAAQGKVADAREIMATATGEALRSEAYQNNRAFLDSLKEPEMPKVEAVKVEAVKVEAVKAEPAKKSFKLDKK